MHRHSRNPSRFSWSLILCLGLLLAASLACSRLAPMGANERFIQVTWTHSTYAGDGHVTYLELQFSAGQFSMAGYPPLEQKGRYRVIDSTGDNLTLELTNQSGDLSTDDRQMLLVLNRNADELLVDGDGPFTRSGP